MSEAFPPKPRVIGSKEKICIVASQYNPTYMDALVENTVAELSILIPAVNIVLIRVPGAFEVPITIAKYLTHSKVNGIIALGLLIQGQTAHANLIATSATNALMQLAMTHSVPVIHEILMVNDEQEAHDRCISMEKNRGIEAARAAARMIDIFEEIDKSLRHTQAKSF